MAKNYLKLLVFFCIIFVAGIAAAAIDVGRIPLENSIVIGNPQALTRVFVFTDPDCPFCAVYHSTLKSLVQEHPDIAVYVKMFPLAFHVDAYGKARAILESSSLEMLDRAFEKKDLPPPRNAESKGWVDRSIAIGYAAGITGTPTMVLPNGELFVGAQPASNVLAAIEKSGYTRPAVAVAKAKAEPPRITIISPEVRRGVQVVAREVSLTVAGKAEDGSGVATVVVNGQQARLDESGDFSADILLKPGENRITVVATNVNRLEATERFTVVREAAEAAVAPRPAKPAGGPTATGGYYALIIGNNDYRNLDRLQTAVNDAREIDLELRDDYGFRTKLLLNATRKDILSAINDFRKTLRESDNFLVYYAGHGEFDRTADKAYWLPVDAQRDDPAEWIIADDITSSIRRLSSKHVLVVSDSCYSGTLTRSAQTHLEPGEREAFLKRVTERPSRTLMASGGNEPVADGGGSGHSIFADSFLKALREIETPVFAADELFFRHVKSRVAGKSDQVPQYNEIRNSGHDGGDFVFVKKK
jgi:Caspase domain/Thioredoxin-like domain/Glucodextranase, domain B